eukprot:527076-Prymnesium_polylepis.1
MSRRGPPRCTYVRLLVELKPTHVRAVPAPAWCMTSAWDPAHVVRASRTHAMFVCRVLVAR